jgi:hypothetical protein
MAADRQRLSPPIDAVVISKGNCARRRYRDIHTGTVGDLAQNCTGFDIAKREFSKHRGRSRGWDGLLPSPTTRPADASKLARSLAFPIEYYRHARNRVDGKARSLNRERDHTVRFTDIWHRLWCRQICPALYGIVEVLLKNQ